MTFKDSFCPSPWFHMRINNSGTYEPCRWKTHGTESRVNFDNNIQTKSPDKYFQEDMSGLRSELLAGNRPSMCQDCCIMEQHDKTSGRQRQLLKIGVRAEYFEKSLLGSPLKSDFDYSDANQGHTTRTVSDWQIDLGNYCNSSCIFCSPESSSSLATEFKKLGLIDTTPPPAWCDDPVLLERFITDLINSPKLHYIHFIGGETLITPGFKKILQALVDHNLAGQTTIGFTTNLTVWSDSIVELLTKFKQVNLGMSIETLSKINDYVRYPSQHDQTLKILDQWVNLGQQHNWLMQLRITPTCLTVHELDTVYEYAWQHRLAVESCNFLDRPKFLRIGVLPVEYQQRATQRLQTWVDEHALDTTEKVINTRNPNMAHQQIIQDAISYLNYLKSAEDESYRLPELIEYLKRLESNRKNSIIDYIPEYENLFRSQGY